MTLFKGWRTIAFNVISAAVMVTSLPEVAAVLPAECLPWLALGNAVGNLGLRYFTTTPVGRKA